VANVQTTIPVAFASNVYRNVFLTAQFDVDLSRDSITDLTVLLIRSSDNDVVDGVVDYILGTRTITFQLDTLLDAETNYTWILVGRSTGIKEADGLTAALASNERVTFTTGAAAHIDPTIPLATDTRITGTMPAFAGGNGVYNVVFGRTGEPISHVVTTAGQIGPSGVIVPAPAGSAVYLAASGSLVPDPIAVSGTTDPANGDSFLDTDDMDDISAWFTDTPVISGLTDDGVSVEVEDILQLSISQPVLTVSIDENRLDITPSFWSNGATYTVTLSSDISGENLAEMESDYTFSFVTKPKAFYTTVKKVRINIGSVASKITDTEIIELIYENSLWAYENHRTGFAIESPPSYVEDYVLCKTKMDILNRVLMASSTPTSRKIGEVEFRYGSNMTDRFKKKIEEIEDCIKDSEKLILSGGERPSMTTATKSLNYTGRPGTSNSWSRIGTYGGFRNTRNAPGGS